jgi:hypothetical protein
MPAPQEVLDLAARFSENLPAYTAGRYNETQLRRDASSAGLSLSILRCFEEFAVYD